MNRTNLIAACAISAALLGAAACDRTRMDQNRAGDASTTGATVPGSDRDRSGTTGGATDTSGAGQTSAGAGQTGVGTGQTGTGMGQTGTGTNYGGGTTGDSGRMSNMGSAADRDTNLGIRDGGSVAPGSTLRGTGDTDSERGTGGQGGTQGQGTSGTGGQGGSQGQGTSGTGGQGGSQGQGTSGTGGSGR